MPAPREYPRRILLAVTGLSPQILTETLYALAVGQPQAFVPTEIHLITTREGAQRARLALLSDDPGWFHRLCVDYQLPPIAFDAAHIHLLANAGGEALDDIRSPDDNRAAADFITEKVRHFSADPDAALHVSIAGGRKTMGYYLGYALSLFGREQDRLSHVLVSEPFESSWDFFYPTPTSRIITTRDNKLADTAAARVTLADIPFVSLRHGLPRPLLEGQASFAATVDAARNVLAPPRLVIDLTRRRIEAAGRAVAIPPAELALLALFARRALTGADALAAPPKGSPDSMVGTLYLAERRLIGGHLADLERCERAYAHGMDGEAFSSLLSKLHRRLTDTLGPAAAPYLIANGGRKPYRYRLTVAEVEFGEVAGDCSRRKLAACAAPTLSD